MAVDTARAIVQLSRDGRALSAAARAGDLTAPVPACPGWTVADAVGHTAEVYQHKLAVLEGLRQERPTGWQQEPPGGDVVQWYDDSLAALVAALRAHPADARVWSWYDPDPTVAFWARRMMQETVIHRADVELASGPAHHVDAAVANDGIDEVLERFLCFDVEAYREVAGSGQTVAVQTADEAWHVTLGSDRATLRRGHEEAAATVAGTPSHVLYWLWGRVPDDAVFLRGDADAAGALRRALVATTQ